MICAVCGEEARARLNSLVAPVVLFYCIDCMIRYAEPLKLIHRALSEGGAHPTWMKRITSRVDGHYIDWEEIVKLWEPGSDYAD